MAIERKSYSVAEMKVADDQPGIIEAIVSVFSNVDLGNEKVMPGFFAKSIEKKLPKGVWAHDWKQPIAKTLEAKELLPGDPRLPQELMTLGGAYIKGQFNLDTQRGREAYSDIKFGIVDEFSIGYSVVKDQKDKESGARELIEGDWKEWSPVLVGMNDQTRLISIKSDDEKLSEEQIKAILDQANDDFYLKVIAASESFESFDKAALAALKKFIENMQRNHEARVKEGRVLSSSNRATVQACSDQIDELTGRLSALKGQLNDLLTMSEPKPKEKEIDVEALRTQSLRLRSQIMLTLARP